MNIMLTGASGTGKSTLALALSQKYPKYLFIPSFVTKTAKEVGFDINKPYTFAERIKFQWRLLEKFRFYIEASAKTPMIFDRSPLCMAAYLDCEAGIDLEEWQQTCDYVDECLNLVEDFDTLIVYCPPFPTPVEARVDRPDLSIHGTDYNLRCDNFITNYCGICWDTPQVHLTAEQSVPERVEKCSELLDLVEWAF